MYPYGSIRKPQVPYAPDRPGWAATVFGTYEKVLDECQNGVRTPGTMLALHQLTMREHELIQDKREKINAWLIEQDYPAQIIMTTMETGNRLSLWVEGKTTHFLCMETPYAIFDLKMRWL